jgi:hypothetical protein
MISKVTRLRRNEAIALLRSFAVRKITNDQFEERLEGLMEPGPVRKWEDKSIWAIRTSIWYIYDDLHEHKLEGKSALTREQKRWIARIILFLKSDREYEWRSYCFIPFLDLLLFFCTLGLWSLLRLKKPKEEIDWDIWPFRTKAQLDEERLRRI